MAVKRKDFKDSPDSKEIFEKLDELKISEFIYGNERENREFAGWLDSLSGEEAFYILNEFLAMSGYVEEK